MVKAVITGTGGCGLGSFQTLLNLQDGCRCSHMLHDLGVDLLNPQGMVYEFSLLADQLQVTQDQAHYWMWGLHKLLVDPAVKCVWLQRDKAGVKQAFEAFYKGRPPEYLRKSFPGGVTHMTDKWFDWYWDHVQTSLPIIQAAFPGQIRVVQLEELNSPQILDTLAWLGVKNPVYYHIHANPA